MYINHSAHFAAPTKGESNYKAVAEIKARSVRLNEDLGAQHVGVARQRPHPKPRILFQRNSPQNTQPNLHSLLLILKLDTIN
jgi:hypothetical protein